MTGRFKASCLITHHCVLAAHAEPVLSRADMHTESDPRSQLTPVRKDKHSRPSSNTPPELLPSSSRQHTLDRRVDRRLHPPNMPHGQPQRWDHRGRHALHACRPRHLWLTSASCPLLHATSSPTSGLPGMAVAAALLSLPHTSSTWACPPPPASTPPPRQTTVRTTRGPPLPGPLVLNASSPSLSESSFMAVTCIP